MTAADRTFATAADASNRFEIDTGTLALAKGTSAVRPTARMFVRDHTKSAAELKKAVGALGGSVGETIETGVLQKELQALEMVKGTAFDRAFRADQIAAHRQAIALFAKAGPTLSPPLRDFAQETLPVLRKHLAAAQALPR